MLTYPESFWRIAREQMPLTAVLRCASRAMMRARPERPGVSFCRHLSAFAAQLLHACSDHSKIISGAGSGALAAQLLHACPDHGKIISGAGSGHVHGEPGPSVADYTVRSEPARRLNAAELRVARGKRPCIAARAANSKLGRSVESRSGSIRPGCQPRNAHTTPL